MTSETNPLQVSHVCKCELCVCVCHERNIYSKIPACPPCYIRRIQEHIKDCMIGVHPNSVSPEEIEKQISEWQPYSNCGHRETYWEEYWEKLVDDNKVVYSGDIYSWLEMLGAPIPESLPSHHECHICELVEIERVYCLVARSGHIKRLMWNATKEGRNILIKRENLKKKYKSLIKYVLYDKNQKRRYDSSNVMFLPITSYLL